MNHGFATEFCEVMERMIEVGMTLEGCGHHDSDLSAESPTRDGSSHIQAPTHEPTPTRPSRHAFGGEI